MESTCVGMSVGMEVDPLNADGRYQDHLAGDNYPLTNTLTHDFTTSCPT